MKRPFEGFHRMSLRAALTFGFALVLVLTLIVGAIALWGQYRAAAAMDRIQTIDNRIAELSLESNVSMLRARRAEKDFLLFQDDFGFSEARSRYVTLLRTNLDDIGRYMAGIRALTGRPEWVRQTRAVDRLAGRYEAGFRNVVDLYGQLGHVDTGLESRLREHAHGIESNVRAAGQDRLLADLLMLRRHEKDFIARRQNKYAGAFADGIDRFKTDLSASALPAAQKKTLRDLADAYAASFEQYREIRRRIETEKAQYLAAVREMEPLLEGLQSSAAKSAETMQSEIRQTLAATLWRTLGAISLTALLGLGIARSVSGSIAKSVGECLDFARRVAGGDLAARLAARGEHEFGALARALNVMTLSLQASKKKLEAHAVELSESNRVLHDEILVRRRTEDALRRLGRARQVMAHCNHVLVHAASEEELLKDMCAAVVEKGGYHMAWIGYAQHDEAKSIMPVSRAGYEAGYLDTLRLNWSEDQAAQNGAAGSAIRTGRPVVIRDILNDPQSGPWRPGAIQRGYASLIALPLQSGGEALGSFSIYAKEPDAFDEDEVELLTELANDAAFGIASLRTGHAYSLAEAALRLRNRAIESSINAIAIIGYDKSARSFEYANPAFEKMTGYTAAEIADAKNLFVRQGEGEQPSLAELRRAWAEKREGHAMLRSYRKDGGMFWSDTYVAPVRDEAGRVTHYVVVLNDITETKNYESQLERQANYDTLTGLANRNLLRDRIRQAIVHARRHRRTVPVICIDLDNFKMINDSLGHDTGDELLKIVAERIRSSVRESDTVARLGADEFVVVLSNHAEMEDVPGVARRIADAVSSYPRIGEILRKLMDAVSQTATLAEREVSVTCSIGLSLYPADGEDVDVLLKNADAAMYRAKQLGRNNFQFYTAELNARMDERLALQTMLRHALEREEFALHYQPKVDLASGRLSGMEALLRWNHPEKGPIPPYQFIPILEDSGMIVEVGRWVAGRAMADCRQWRSEGRPPVRVAVNVSQVQLGQKNFVDLVEEIVGGDRGEAAGLDLEITESLIMTDAETNIPKLKAIRDLGLRIAIDDFGTGYSSLSYLAKLPVDALKIDRAFIMNITANADDLAIVSTIISLAHSLKLKVIAEGVETEAQAELLRQLECDEIQGYLLSPAVPAQDFWTWHEEFSRRPGFDSRTGNRQGEFRDAIES